MRAGITLPELLLVLALVGILLGIAIPQLSAALDRIEVTAAASHIASAHGRARLMAITRSQVMVLTIDSLALTIRARSQPAALWSQQGPAYSRVSLASSNGTFTLSPEGFSMSLSNATLRVSRGKATRAVIISRLGRVRITE